MEDHRFVSQGKPGIIQTVGINYSITQPLISLQQPSINCLRVVFCYHDASFYLRPMYKRAAETAVKAQIIKALSLVEVGLNHLACILHISMIPPF